MKADMLKPPKEDRGYSSKNSNELIALLAQRNLPNKPTTCFFYQVLLEMIDEMAIDDGEAHQEYSGWPIQRLKEEATLRNYDVSKPKKCLITMLEVSDMYYLFEKSDNVEDAE